LLATWPTLQDVPFGLAGSEVAFFSAAVGSAG